MSKGSKEKYRYSVSLITQGKHRFYTLTMPSDVLSECSFVSRREDDPERGFQRLLDEKRAMEIAKYIDSGFGTIPSSIVLSAQPEAKFKDVGKGKTIEFYRNPKAFLVLDGQHRVYGFSKAKSKIRVPVVIYNDLSRNDETKLFIDINTKQRPVPNVLLLDRGYVFYKNITRTSFEFALPDYEIFLRSIAFDINRLGCASIESLNEIYYKKHFPKSHAWKCIKVYYSAYYSAHAMMRMMGESCSYFETNTIRSIEQLANNYGQRGNVNIESGLYHCSIDATAMTVSCIKLANSGKKGSHELMWGVYLKLIDRIISEINKMPAEPIVQGALGKLSDLRNNLVFLNSVGGNWLSEGF